MRRIAIGALGVGLLLPVQHAFGDCSAGSKSFQTWMHDDKTKVVNEQVTGLAEKAARDTPRAAASSKQQSAPSISGIAATLIDSPGFSELISAAFDRNVGSKGSDAVTVNLNPFTFAAIGNPSVYYDQEVYQKTEYEWLRKIGGAVSFGGKGDAFDRDGDGKVDDALESENFDDIVGWEVRARVYGSRDRRDPDNFAIFTQKISAAGVQEAHEQAEQQLLSDDRLWTFLDVRNNPEMCLTESHWHELRTQPWFADKYERTLSAAVALNKAYAAAADEIDNRMLWTIAATGLERDKKFGPDKHGVSIRGTWRAASFNFDWKNVEGLGKEHDSNEFKVGAKYATQIFKGGYWTDGIDASASFAYERFDNVPDSKHDNNVQLQGRFDIPVMDGVTIPFSVSWANHRDLFSDKDEVIGHFGINVDTSKLLDKTIVRQMMGNEG